MHMKGNRAAAALLLAEQKNELRRTMRAARNSLDRETRVQASVAIGQRLASLPQLQKCARVAVYLATPSEANIDALTSTLIDRGAIVVAPALSEHPTFARLLDVENGVTTSEKGLRVPATSVESSCMAASELDVILVPALAFDRSGARLGQGGGWYDRVLAETSHVVAIGVCFDCQLVDAVPVESHDQRVSLIVTEEGVIDVVQGTAM
jgi:5-formyltetrahydrofolate cyclo-ligase